MKGIITVSKNIQIQFVGNNSHDVTGSCIWIKTPHRQILLECGLYQSAGNLLDVYNINNAPFKFNPKEIDYVFINHTHIDHCGLLPLLYKRGSAAATLIPDKNAVITEILLRDSAKVAQADALDLSKKYKRKYEPLYDNDDVTDAMNHIEEWKFNKIIELDEYVKFRFIPSGHILGAAQLELWITEGYITKKILYTSDLGNVHIQKSFVAPFEPVDKADIVIGESTYGDEEYIAKQKTRDKDIEKIKHAVEEICSQNRGKILIPVFANARAQEILMLLYQLFGNDSSFRYPVLFDTPMGIAICKAYAETLEHDDKVLFEKALKWDHVKFITDPIESKTWMQVKGPAVILSTSGMMTHGRTRAWCRNLLPDSRNMILFCGFSIEGSLADIIKNNTKKKIKLSGQWVANKCKILNLRSFSSHMQRDSLVSYYASIDCEKIYLVHGSKDSKNKLRELTQTAICKNNKTSRVVCTTGNDKITL